MPEGILSAEMLSRDVSMAVQSLDKAAFEEAQARNLQELEF
eukprot:CAMPEP_0170503000 /NCGR_PEP_ID=MMETSP0208-20121228/43310_1 /TAXON_ID=197538 /ORGANISM="Strombidium inclinatum, Strain S3" /LENGTH=40 /DNA_ID= /DNA_START= /DNA_END= /DNA_ORIENTATION=